MLEFFFITKNRAVWEILEPIQNRAISRFVLFEALLYTYLPSEVGTRENATF